MAAIDADLQAAYLYTFPYYEMARTRYLMVGFASNPQRGDVNALSHRRTLADANARGVTTPNNDTLYSSAWLDLSAGPLEITVPRIAARYWSLQFMDASSSTVALLGSRTMGEGDFKLWVVREGDVRTPPSGARVLRMPSRDVWMLARFGVDGAPDLPAVQALQDGLRLQSVEPGPPPRGPVAPARPLGSPEQGASYLAVTNDMLARNGVPAAERDRVATWSSLGPGSATPTAEQAARWDNALPALNLGLRAAAGGSGAATTVMGWSYPNKAIGTYGSNYALRAGVALGGLAALPPEEALYLSATTDSRGQALDGRHRYRVQIPPRGVDAGAFWSLSMYEIDPDGRQFFVNNAIQRFAIGDRTGGLLENADGSMDIAVQFREPADAVSRANWLPSPEGSFRLVLRAYLPSAALIEGRAPLPVVERLP